MLEVGRTVKRTWVRTSTPGLVAIEWLLPGWVTVCGRVNHLGM